MEALDREVEKVLSSTISDNTRNMYIGAITQFVMWLSSHEDCRHLLSCDFTAAAEEEDGCVTSAFTRTWLMRRPFKSPILLSILTYRDFCRFVVDTKDEQGESFGKSKYGSLRSGLVYLYTMSGLRMDVEFAAQLTVFYKGIRYTLTKTRQSTNARLKEGKEPFSFSFYRSIGLELLRSAHRDCIFTRAFLLLSWNLMCRAANTEAIRHAHVYWNEDSIAIKFSHMKNDQEGDRPGDARHVYANPLIPELCPILSLAIYFAVFGFSSDGKIFPGSNQYDRYTKALKRTLQTSNAKSLIASMGLKPSDFGSHSARKGSATYVSSCSSAGPSAAAICLRAGWNLPGVQNTYIRYEAAGDMTVGRFVSGLPFDSASFAILPPFFSAPCSIVDQANALCFPGAPANLRRTCEFFLASLVYHEPFLRSNLDPNHLLFETPLFCQPNLIHQLRDIVKCCNYSVQHPIRPTGLPPHIGTYLEMARIRESVAGLRSGIVSDIKEVIVEHVTPSGINDERLMSALETVLERRGIGMAQSSTPLTSESCPPPALVPFTWGGRFHLVPEKFSFPKGTLMVAWVHWCCGDSSKGYPPYKHLLGHDMASDNNKKRLSDFRKVMTMIERCLDSMNVDYSNPTPDEAGAMFISARGCFPRLLGSPTGVNKERNSWVSFVRRAQRRRRHQNLNV